MGLRGIGAVARPRITAARLAAMHKPRDRRILPWKKRGLDRVGRVMAFLQFLPVTKGIRAGKKLELLPDQREFIEAVYGRQKPNDVRRLISLAIKSAPKGNGKTGLTAGLALCHLLGPEAELRGEVYSASIDKSFAAKLFTEMVAIILAVPQFTERVNIIRHVKILEVLSGDGKGSIYEALSADARKAQGLAPSLWIYDELAQVKDRELLDNLLEGMSKRREALGIIISTQARDDFHPLSVLIDDGLKNQDPSTYVHLIAASDDVDPFDDEVLRSVNPAWGKFLDLDDLMRSRDRAMRLKAFEGAYRNLRLNQRIDANDENRIVTPAVWNLGAVPLRIRDEALCYGGLDLSGKHDLTALVLAFPDRDGGFDLLPFFWTPLGQLAGRGPTEQERFRQWIREGHMIGVDGPVIEFRYVAAQIAAICRRYQVEAIGYDRWRIDELKHELNKLGARVPLEPFGQGYKEMAPAVEYFAELALSARLRHNGHPVLNACVSNAILTRADDAGNQKFAKGKSNQGATVRIDGVVAAAMATGTAQRKTVTAKPAPSYQMMVFG